MFIYVQNHFQIYLEREIYLIYPNVNIFPTAALFSLKLTLANIIFRYDSVWILN